MSTRNELPYVRWAGVDIAPPRSAMQTRRIYDHEIVYTLSGSGSVIFEGQKFFAGTDHCFFHQPRQPHAACNDNDEAWVTIGVHFDWEITPDTEQFSSFRADDRRQPTDENLFRVPQSVEGWNHQKQRVLDLRGRPSVRHFLEEVVTAFSRSDGFSRRQAGALLIAAICQLQREVALISDANQLRVVGPDAQRRLMEASALLEQVTPEMLSVGQIAAHVGWSSDYLGFMARTAWGITPSRLQMNARLAQVRALLREGYAVAEVAHLCGFADTSHLARAFRKESGLTPRQYSSLARRKK